MTPSEIINRIETDDDFVNLKRYNYSIEEAIDRNPDGLSFKMIAQGLGMSEEDAVKAYESAVKRLQKALGVKIGD